MDILIDCDSLFLIILTLCFFLPLSVIAGYCVTKLIQHTDSEIKKIIKEIKEKRNEYYL